MRSCTLACRTHSQARMCMFSCHKTQPDPDFTVAARPLTSTPARPLSSAAQRPPLAPLTSQSRIPRHSQQSLRPLSVQSHLQASPRPVSPTGQVIIVEHRTPRASSGALAQDRGVSVGNRPVSTERRVSHSQRNPARRSGASVSERPVRRLSEQDAGRSGLYGKDPRSSNMSVRSTRERVVIVDGSGPRKTYIR